MSPASLSEAGQPCTLLHEHTNGRRRMPEELSSAATLTALRSMQAAGTSLPHNLSVLLRRPAGSTTQLVAHMPALPRSLRPGRQLVVAEDQAQQALVDLVLCCQGCHSGLTLSVAHGARLLQQRSHARHGQAARPVCHALPRRQLVRRALAEGHRTAGQRATLLRVQAGCTRKGRATARSVLGASSWSAPCSSVPRWRDWLWRRTGASRAPRRRGPIGRPRPPAAHLAHHLDHSGFARRPARQQRVHRAPCKPAPAEGASRCGAAPGAASGSGLCGASGGSGLR